MIWLFHLFSSITSEVIEDIAHKLKTKSAVTAADLRTLKNGLMDDPKNIDVFLNVHGALRGLVRELTGNSQRSSPVMVKWFVYS